MCIMAYESKQGWAGVVPLHTLPAPSWTRVNHHVKDSLVLASTPDPDQSGDDADTEV